MKQYYHGTDYFAAYRILKEGVRRLQNRTGCAVKGDGTYITDDLDYAYSMAKFKSSPNNLCIIECELSIDKPILWIDGNYDKKVIKYLKKEFSKNIVDYSKKIDKLIPKNKHLTKTEVINLVNYWDSLKKKYWDSGRESKLENGETYFAENCRKLISKLNYSGWGERTNHHWDSNEIVIFNSSHIRPIKYWSATAIENYDNWTFKNAKLTEEITEQELREGYEKEIEIIKKDADKWDESFYDNMYK